MHQKSVIAIALAVAVAGSAGYLLAGPLDPPPGPVQPSYRTIQEVYDRIDMLTPGPFCDNGPWDSLYTPNNVSGAPLEIIAGDGLLHAVIVRINGSLVLSTDGGATPIARLDVDVSSRIVLNVRYTNGLWLEGNAEDLNTILYRADPPAASAE